MDTQKLAMPAAPSAISPAPSVLQLRTHARAIGYNPDRPSAVAALACVAGVETNHLAAVFAGHANLDRLTRIRVLRTLGLSTSDSDPDMDEALRRARAGRPAVAA